MVHAKGVISLGILLALVLSTSLLGIGAGSLVKKQILVSNPKAADGPGGACNTGVNNGCGGEDGCREWEWCKNGSCEWRAEFKTGFQTCGEQGRSTAPQPTAAPQDAQPTSAPSINGCDAAWYCLGECANNEVKNAMGQDSEKWRRLKIEYTNRDNGTSYTSCTDETTLVTPGQEQPSTPPSTTTPNGTTNNTSGGVCLASGKEWPAGNCQKASQDWVVVCKPDDPNAVNTSWNGQPYRGWVRQKSCQSVTQNDVFYPHPTSVPIATVTKPPSITCASGQVWAFVSGRNQYMCAYPTPTVKTSPQKPDTSCGPYPFGKQFAAANIETAKKSCVTCNAIQTTNQAKQVIYQCTRSERQTATPTPSANIFQRIGTAIGVYRPQSSTTTVKPTPTPLKTQASNSQPTKIITATIPSPTPLPYWLEKQTNMSSRTEVICVKTGEYDRVTTDPYTCCSGYKNGAGQCIQYKSPSRAPLPTAAQPYTNQNAVRSQTVCPTGQLLQYVSGRNQYLCVYPTTIPQPTVYTQQQEGLTIPQGGNIACIPDNKRDVSETDQYTCCSGRSRMVTRGIFSFKYCGAAGQIVTSTPTPPAPTPLGLSKAYIGSVLTECFKSGYSQRDPYPCCNKTMKTPYGNMCVDAITPTNTTPTSTRIPGLVFDNKNLRYCIENGNESQKGYACCSGYERTDTNAAGRDAGKKICSNRPSPTPTPPRRIWNVFLPFVNFGTQRVTPTPSPVPTRTPTPTRAPTPTKVPTPRPTTPPTTTPSPVVNNCNREPSSNEVILYEHANFEGSCITLTGNSAQLFNFDNKISSYKVGSAVELAAYSGINFGNDEVFIIGTYTGNGSSLVGIGTNDIISSVKVVPRQ